ncbi:MAG TPA: PilZ domain-containing protein [Syntrophobacteria bacterium]|nr:PilZ domain-containing protein [Syntrophobacteria bacterium]
MDTTERREYPRSDWSFPVLLSKEDLEGWVHGTSVNVSQSGAFIRTENWPLFRVDEPATIIWTLPTEFTGQSEMISLQGEAIVCRVDHHNHGIAVQFLKSFKAFERINGRSSSNDSSRLTG